MAITAEMREKLESALKKKGWTQRDLHKKTKIAESTISRIFSGEAESASISTLAKIADAIGLKVTLRKKQQKTATPRHYLGGQLGRRGTPEPRPEYLYRSHGSPVRQGWFVVSISNRIPIPDDVARKGAAMFDIALDGSSTVNFTYLCEVWRAARRAQTHESLIIVYPDGEIETSDGVVIDVTGKPASIVRELAHGPRLRNDLRNAVWKGTTVEEVTIDSNVSRARAALRRHGLTISTSDQKYSIEKRKKLS